MPAYTPDQIAAYQAYLQKFQGSQQAKQQAGPSPFQPAENQDKQKLDSGQIAPDMMSRAPESNKSALRNAADAVSAGVGGLVKGATFGSAPIQYPGMAENMEQHRDASQYGELAGAAASSAGIGKLLGAAGGGISGMIGKAIESKVPGAGKLIDLIKGASSGPVAGAGQTASEVGEGAAQMSDSAVNAAQALKPRIDPFTVRKR